MISPRGFEPACVDRRQCRRVFREEWSPKFGVTIKRFEDLFADSLRLYQPILDKIAGHKDAIQKDIASQRDSLTGVLDMMQVARGVEVLADRARELETEAKGIEASITENTKTMEKIDDLLGRTRCQMPDGSRQNRDEGLADPSDESDDFMPGLRKPGTKSGIARKPTGR